MKRFKFKISKMKEKIVNEIQHIKEEHLIEE